MIYFIQNTRSLAVKIGVSRSPEGRLATLRTASPDELRLLGSIPGGRDAETGLHARFARFRIRPKGEWFRGEPELLDAVFALVASGRDASRFAWLGSSRDWPGAGTHPAVVVGLIASGAAPAEFLLAWDLVLAERRPGGRPHVLAVSLPASFEFDAPFRAVVEQLVGHVFGDDEVFDTESLLGRPCLLGLGPRPFLLSACPPVEGSRFPGPSHSPLAWEPGRGPLADPGWTPFRATFRWPLPCAESAGDEDP